MKVKIRESWAPVYSWREASELVRSAIDEDGIGNSNYGYGQITDRMSLTTDDTRRIAHVSYNGKVWSGAEYVAGTKPLYDPFAEAI